MPAPPPRRAALAALALALAAAAFSIEDDDDDDSRPSSSGKSAETDMHMETLDFDALLALWDAGLSEELADGTTGGRLRETYSLASLWDAVERGDDGAAHAVTPACRAELDALHAAAPAAQPAEHRGMHAQVARLSAECAAQADRATAARAAPSQPVRAHGLFNTRRAKRAAAVQAHLDAHMTPDLGACLERHLRVDDVGRSLLDMPQRCQDELNRLLTEYDVRGRGGRGCRMRLGARDITTTHALCCQWPALPSLLCPQHRAH